MELTEHLSTPIPCTIDLLFETSWEVCNKVGGIYTVLSTKAKELEESLRDKLVFIGPDLWSPENPCPVFKENKRLLRQASKYIKLPNGLSIRTGRWQIPGEPIVVLVNFNGIYSRLPEIYGKMWEAFGVDSLHSYGDYDESCAFAVASAIVIDAIRDRLGIKPQSVVAHFDEWTTGMGLLYLRLIRPEIAEIFTTHATSIGRSISGNGKQLYKYFKGYYGDQMAQELNMQSKHSLEKAAAHTADCFTTVSDVTADECEQLLDIRPQVVTPNGFDLEFVPDATTRKAQRITGRKRLIKTASKLCGREIADNVEIVATSGRNEFRNKGIDLFLDSIALLRTEENRLAKEILALVLVPAWTKEPSQILTDNAKSDNDAKSIPNFLTHRLNNEDSDAITQKIISMGGNDNNQKVTLMFVPCYLDGRDGIINIPYYNLLPAVDLTIFPSYYEPWGYTPLESVAFGIPTITTDKAGFGLWVSDNVGNGLKASGVKVIHRDDDNYEADVHEIAETVISLLETPAPELKEISEKSFETANKAQWKLFIQDYYTAFAIAEKRRNERLK